jgi:hypothetical protein
MPAVSGTLNCPGDAMKKRGGRVSVRRRLGWDLGDRDVFATIPAPLGVYASQAIARIAALIESPSRFVVVLLKMMLVT